MELWIVRHGPAEEPDARRWPRDDDRPLTAAGADLIGRVAPALALAIGGPRSLAVSPALRARATAALLAPAFSPPAAIETWAELAPGATAPPLFARLARGAAAEGPLPVLVGHAPTFNELVGLAVAGVPLERVRIPRGGACRLAFSGPLRSRSATVAGPWAPEEILKGRAHGDGR